MIKDAKIIKLISSVDIAISKKELNYMSFTCTRCNFNHDSMEIVSNHIDSCEKEEIIIQRNEVNQLKFELERIDTEKKYLNKKIRKLDLSIIAKDKEICDLTSTLKIENVVNNMLTNIVEKYTKFDINDIIKKEHNKVHIYDTGVQGVIPIYLHNSFDNNTFEDSEKQLEYKVINTNMVKIEKSAPSRNKYKKISGLELKDELKEEEIISKVDTIDEESKLITETIFNPMNKNECREIISSIFKNISESRIYSKYIQQLKDVRINMLKWINVKEYEIMLNEHVINLKNIFLSKSYDKLKIKKITTESLTNMEKRMIKFGNYFNTQIDGEEIDKIRISLDNCTDFPKEYVPFKLSFKKMQNYSLALFSLKRCLKSFIINKYGFNNLVYIKLSNSSEKDPHSFYYLNKIVCDERHWNMDSRLEDVSIELSNSLYPYCLELYRKIYFDSFSNHVYKFNYEDALPNIYNELDQIAENMILLHNYESCRYLLIEIIKEFAILQPTEKDKINLKTQDSSQKAKFKEYNKNYDRNDIVNSLFANVNEKIYLDFFNRFKK
jgi:hypothetical protein